IIKQMGMDEPDSPGCSIAIAQAGEIVYSRGYGMAFLEGGIRNTPATVFHAASLAKQFTAMAILLLVRAGQIALDDDVHKHLEIPHLRPKVTIRQMLHHISGVRDFLDLLTLKGLRWGVDLMTRDDVLDLATRMESLNFDPGERFLYSNTNYF